jgi:hypothetical protein
MAGKSARKTRLQEKLWRPGVMNREWCEALENPEYDRADKGEGDIRGNNA